MKRISIFLMIVFLVFGLTISTHAVLIDRGGGMIYSTDLDVTWLQDANYALTSGFDGDGLMTWYEAMEWAETLTYGGYDDWRLPTFDPANPSQCDVSTLHEMRYLIYTELGNELYHKCIADLEPVLGRKRAKESARFFKTYNSQIQADVMFNMRSFANFIKLRNSEHAQKEIREIAQRMWDLVATIEGEPFKFTLEAIWNGRD